jgi:hypothetical protein
LIHEGRKKGTNIMSLWDRVLSARHGDKLKPATATTAAATPVQSTATDEARVRAAEAERVRNLATLCSLADQPDRASAFIENGTTLSEALATLSAEAGRVHRMAARFERKRA